ncbi:MAG: class I SAM-dependent methyltransferase, partial [Verrucomicrobia bacterium]|nr:class I SAM-dependent methyltransferase [Verrucomicrobiota bacterium]
WQSFAASMAADTTTSNDETPASNTPQVCDLCGEASYRIFSRRGRHGAPIATVICNGCGLVYTNPRMSDEENAKWYKSGYWGDYKKQQAPDEAFFERRLPKIREIFGQVRPFLKPGVKVLEIGSGVGALLSRIAAEAGEDATIIGIEPHAGHATFARENKGLDVRNGLLDDIAPELEKGRFDLVVMNHVLEHTISPTDTLRTIKALLKPGGTFIVEVPNVEAPGSRITHFFHAAHHYAFSPATFERLARKTGFAVKTIAALDGDLRGTRLNAILEKPAEAEADSGSASDGDLPKDDAASRAEALRAYGRWYWLTAASLRKKITHWKRQRAV